MKVFAYWYTPTGNKRGYKALIRQPIYFNLLSVAIWSKIFLPKFDFQIKSLMNSKSKGPVKIDFFEKKIFKSSI